MIPLPAQQFMAKLAGATVVEVGGSHAIFVSNPKAVAALMETADAAVTSKASSRQELESAGNDLPAL